jgi:ATP-dependent helicase/nuclease subunit A
MTIHKSKGLEFSICYYPGLYKDFNLQDLKERFFYNKEMGIITPIFDEGIRDIFYKNIIKENYYLEEISEKIRLFYVALTRAKEKMIMVCDLNDENDNKKNKDGLIDNNIRLRYRSFLDILLSIKNYITDNITNVEVDNLTKNYDKIKKINFKEKINLTDERINVEKINIEKIIEEEKSYSKNETKLFNKDEIKYMKLGTELHSIFEMSDLKNYNNENEYVSIFLKQDLVKDIKNANIFKEYEFMYEKDNILFH